MTTLQAGSLPRILSNEEPIPEAVLSYVEQRAVNSFYNYVLEKYRLAKVEDNLSKADLARRINKGQDQVNRWLASPSNWTIGTVARLLVGIRNEEAKLNSLSFLGRAPSNQKAIDLLEEISAQESPVSRATSVTASAKLVLETADYWPRQTSETMAERAARIEALYGPYTPPKNAVTERHLGKGT